MKRIIVPLLMLYSAHSIKSMEIFHMTKNSGETTSLLTSSNYKHSSTNTLQQDSFIAQLPKEIGWNILHKLLLLEINRSGSLEITKKSLDHMVILELMLRAKEKSPLTIGNKTLYWQDLIRLRNDQQDELFNLGNPHFLYSYITGFNNTIFSQKTYYKNEQFNIDEKEHAITTLQKQPAFITKGLNIKIKEGYTAMCGLCCILAGAGCGWASVSSCCMARIGLSILDPCVWLLPTFLCGLSPVGIIVKRLHLMRCCNECHELEYSIDNDRFV